MRASMNTVKSTTNLENGTGMHQKRKSFSSYSSFMTKYENRNTVNTSKRTSHVKMSMQVFTVEDEIEEEDDVIPEEGSSPERETASNTLLKYNSKMLSNKTKFTQSNIRNDMVRKSQGAVMSATLNHIPLSKKLKKPMFGVQKSYLNQPNTRKTFRNKIRTHRSHIEDMQINPLDDSLLEDSFVNDDKRQDFTYGATDINTTRHATQAYFDEKGASKIPKIDTERVGTEYYSKNKKDNKLKILSLSDARKNKQMTHQRIKNMNMSRVETDPGHQLDESYTNTLGT